MYDNLEDIRGAVLSDLNVSSNSSLYPTATVNQAINRAYVKISRLFRWSALEDAKYTTTQANQNYYDVPSNWIPDSMWRVTVDDEVYGESPDGSPISFSDFLQWKEDYPNSTDKKWAAQNLRIFISPTPSDASSTIKAWGYKNITKLTNDSDQTIFTSNLPDVNEAIALEASAILKKKGTDPDKGSMYSAEATQIAVVAFNRISSEQQKYEKNLPMFDVPDMFRGNRPTQVTGNFTNTEGYDI